MGKSNSITIPLASTADYRGRQSRRRHAIVVGPSGTGSGVNCPPAVRYTRRQSEVKKKLEEIPALGQRRLGKSRGCVQLGLQQKTKNISLASGVHRPPSNLLAVPITCHRLAEFKFRTKRSGLRGLGNEFLAADINRKVEAVSHAQTVEP